MSEEKASGLKFPDLGYVWGLGHAAGGSSIGVHMPHMWLPICLSRTNSRDALNKK